MITTLTPNPSLDRTVTLPGPLLRGAVNRLASVTVEPGGKGVNVARVLAASGQPVTTVLPAATHDPLLAAIAALGLPGLTALPVPVAGAARVNTAVTEPDGTTTKLNEPGAGLSAEEVDAVEHALLEALASAPPTATDEHHWAVLSGSLPPGAPVDWYVRLVGLLRPLGVRIAVDTSDAPLAALAAALPGSAPDLIKPNGEELAQLAGVGATDLEEGAMAGDLEPVAAAARVLVDLGIGAVMATLGAAGAVLVTPDGAWHATAPRVPVVSTVGAGDSSVAGYVLADVRGGDESRRLSTAMAYGSAAASLPGTTLPTPADLPSLASVVTAL
ncbi:MULTISPECIES: 1-phosphofructokinase family hexose kinase [unclassified Actinomyces]|uniref:1-phosphofructokinase family hexose kinase n=1 Tax=unclassified Actinomyces TaxID=2609248 RepID=UPI000D028BBF|nr:MULTISPECIES: 1-phosphofructokinase family hexose kinase [unclassified Actinomyces]AVM62544.1 1-phosphofructokinase [Actinomyces sp. oral taxon 897]QQO77218.1 1-phosphofructokinase family hexose kinase [Actinomyces sp. HMT897]